MAEGNAEVVGVAGRTFTDVCGDREGVGRCVMPDVMELDVEDVEEALEWV